MVICIVLTYEREGQDYTIRNKIVFSEEACYERKIQAVRSTNGGAILVIKNQGRENSLWRNCWTRRSNILPGPNREWYIHLITIYACKCAGTETLCGDAIESTNKIWCRYFLFRWYFREGTRSQRNQQEDEVIWFHDWFRDFHWCEWVFPRIIFRFI